MIKRLFLLWLAALSSQVDAQVFMRPFDNAAAIASGGGNIAMPVFSQGINNEALLGRPNGTGIWAGSVLPFGISGWQVAHFTGSIGFQEKNGVALQIVHSGTEDYAEQRFQLMYGRRLGEKLYIGGSALALRASAPEYGSATSATFGLAVLAQPLPQVWVGARIQNPAQQKIGNDLIPSLLRIGATWQPSQLLLINAEVEKDLEREGQVKAGFEYMPLEKFVLRAGVRAGLATRLGFGAGFRLKSGLRADLGAEWHPQLGITPALMISWIKPSKTEPLTTNH
ncbi:MAG: hypothetical protein IT269_14110 [Saprospiraceae bacterium]|jgi:hypothetical protein|nr:hypothetical protein [Saprospiraceae bacterium]